MFKGLTYKKRVQYLLIGILVFSWLAYQMSFKKTLALKTEIGNLELQVEKVSNAPSEIQSLQLELNKIDARIGSFMSQGMEFQDVLLDKITGYCKENNLVLKEFPKAHQYRQQDYLVQTNAIVVEGGFIKLLQLVFELERQFEIGKVVSVKFITREDFRTRKLFLGATIYYQNVKMERI